MEIEKKEKLQGMVVDALREIKEEGITPEERIASRIINPAEIRAKSTSKLHTLNMVILAIVTYTFIGSIFFTFLYTSLSHPIITFLIPITGFVCFLLYKQWVSK